MKITRSVLGDGVLAGVLTIGGIVGTAFAGSSSRSGVPVGAVGFVLFAVPSLLLALRRRRPLAVLVAAAVCTSAYLVLGYAYGPVLITFMIAVYSAARHAPWERVLPVASVALLALLVHLVVPGTWFGLLGVVPVAAWVIVPFSAGFTLRLRHQTAVRARAEMIRQSVDDERFRVAQEVHDIVGHGLAAIKMQADIALHVLAKKPDQAEIALEAISRTSSQALDELRATLAMVRTADAELTPVPGLARLDDLRQRMAEAGVYVRLETSGTPAELPVAVDLTGYRVVQESLTNVLRHSGSRQATVSIRYEHDEVWITVSNPAFGTGTGDGGSGIPGMRDRVQALGGRFTAGPVPQHRFEVHARLPIGGHP